jgi:hypothetical protein
MLTLLLKSAEGGEIVDQGTVTINVSFTGKQRTPFGLVFPGAAQLPRNFFLVRDQGTVSIRLLATGRHYIYDTIPDDDDEVLLLI